MGTLVYECDGVSEHMEGKLRYLIAHNRSVIFTGNTGYKWCRFTLDEGDKVEFTDKCMNVYLNDGLKVSINRIHFSNVTII